MRPYSEWRMIDGKEHLFEVEEYTAPGFQTYWKRRDTGTVKGEEQKPSPKGNGKQEKRPATQAVPLPAEEVKTTATGPVGPQYRTFGPENLQLSTWGTTPGGGNPNEMYQLLKDAQAAGYPNAMDLWNLVPHNAIPGYRQWQREQAAKEAGLPPPVSQGVPPAPPAPPAADGGAANGGADNGDGPGTLNLAGGIEERKLAHTIAAEAANQEYLRRRLNFESDSDARTAALGAAEQQIERVVQARRFGLDLGKFLMEARGPRNYGQYFGILGGQGQGPGLEGGLSSRLETVLGGLGRIARTPNFEVPAGVDLGFGNVLRSMFGGTPVAGAQAAAQPAGQPAVPPTVSPSRIDPTQFARLLPSEQEAVVSMAEASGIPAQDFLTALERSLPGAIPVGTPRQALSSLRL
jgi:hypothetical protein